MAGDLAESVLVLFEGDVLGVSGDTGVVSAEEDSHQADVRDAVRGRAGRKETLQAAESGWSIIAAKATVEDVEAPRVVVRQVRDEDTGGALSDTVAEENELRIHLG